MFSNALIQMARCVIGAAMHDDMMFRCERVVDVLNRLFQRKQAGSGELSLRAWAKQLGINQPSYLSEVLNGKKRISPSFLYRILPFLELDEQQRDYVECLCRIENTDDPMTKEFLRRQVIRIRSGGRNDV